MNEVNGPLVPRGNGGKVKEYYREGCNISYTPDNTPVNYLVPRIESIDATSTVVSSLRNYRDDFHQFPTNQDLFSLRSFKGRKWGKETM